ncbi:MAG: phosphotransferase family protein [Pseudomonadales bacterium]
MDNLATVLARELDGFKALKECQQLTNGASQETFRVVAQTKSGDQQLALRRCPPSQQPDSTVGQISLKTEARLVQLACDARIPAPKIVYVLKESDGLGDGFLMQWLDGETRGQRIVRSESLEKIRPKLARQCGEILARLHAVEVSSELKELLPEITPESLVQDTWAAYQALQVPQAMIDFTARWLLDNLPKDSRQTLVHGDFRNGNLMVDETGLCGVLDWELAQIGDPVRDLGWMCVNSWRFGVKELPVGGFGTVEDMLAGYETVSGLEINASDLKFWQVFGSFWWAVTTLTMAATWRTGETPSLERPVIGRRSSEAQMDCVNLIIPGEYSLPAELELHSGTQLPMPAELLEGVRIFLKDDVASGDQQRHGFLAKVAANSLGIAQREFLYGSNLQETEKKHLCTLLGPGKLNELRWQLVHQLRTDLSLDTPLLADHLRQTVAGQLWIDQPGYSALSSAN